MSSRIFVTGASGYMGSAIAARLARAEHQVIGLTRGEERARALEAAGIQPLIGDLQEPEAIASVMQNCDAVVHAAYDSEGVAAQDQKALEAVRAAAEDGRVRRLLYMSGMWVHGDPHGAVLDEFAPIAPIEHVKWRAAHEELAADLSTHDVAVVILRPTIAYGGSRGILGALFDEAYTSRTVSYPGDGSQHWGLVHRNDVAEAFALAFEHAKGGDAFALSDGSEHTVREIASAIARATGAQARSIPRDEVLKTKGAYGEALLVDQRVNALRARRELGWVPAHTSFVAEVESLLREWQSPREATVR